MFYTEKNRWFVSDMGDLYKLFMEAAWKRGYYGRIKVVQTDQ